MQTIRQRLEAMELSELKEYTLKQLGRGLDIENILDEVLVIAEKQGMALSELTNDYGFREEPDPRAAEEYGRGLAKDEHSRESHLWYSDYRRIIWLIEVIQDYWHRIIVISKEYEECRGGND